MTTTPDLAALSHRPITTVDDLTLLWRAMMGTGGFSRRRLWLIFLDADGAPSPVVMPIDDIPTCPGAGELEGLRTVLEHVGAPAVAMLVSRPGPAAELDSDRRWAEALTPLAPEWPVYLATADDDDAAAPCVVRVLAVD